MTATASTASNAASEMLRMRNLVAGYAGTNILRGINLTINRNEVVSILGRNGVGKTTLVNSIFNLGPQIEGQIFLKGRAVNGLATHQIARQGVALVPQGRGNFLNLTVEESLRLATIWRRNGPAVWTLERIYETFPRLAERRANSGSALSGGERQLLAIARALLRQADFLVLDEPTEGLAPLAVEEVVVQNIQRLAAEGITVLLVEQNVPLALRVAMRVVVLARGSVVYDGAPGTLAEDTDLQREHLGV
jgi:branched-chain amino acid transport system ATP-binding protein